MQGPAEMEADTAFPTSNPAPTLRQSSSSRRSAARAAALVAALLATALADGFSSNAVCVVAAANPTVPDTASAEHASWLDRGAAIFGFGPLAKRDNEPAISPVADEKGGVQRRAGKSKSASKTGSKPSSKPSAGGDDEGGDDDDDSGTGKGKAKGKAKGKGAGTASKNGAKPIQTQTKNTDAKERGSAVVHEYLAELPKLTDAQKDEVFFEVFAKRVPRFDLHVDMLSDCASPGKQVKFDLRREDSYMRAKDYLGVNAEIWLLVNNMNDHNPFARGRTMKFNFGGEPGKEFLIDDKASPGVYQIVANQLVIGTGPTANSTRTNKTNAAKPEFMARVTAIGNFQVVTNCNPADVPQECRPTGARGNNKGGDEDEDAGGDEDTPATTKPGKKGKSAKGDEDDDAPASKPEKKGKGKAGAGDDDDDDTAGDAEDKPKDKKAPKDAKAKDKKKGKGKSGGRIRE